MTLDLLEGRIAPAVAGNLFVQGTTLIWAGTDAANVLTVTTPGPNEISFTDAAGTTISTVPGFASGNTVTGTIPSYITSVAINGNNGVDVISLGNNPTNNAPGNPVLLSRGLIVTAETIVVNNSVETSGGAIGKNLTLNGLVTIASNDPGNPVVIGSNAAPLAGDITINGTLVDSVANNTLTLDAGTGSALAGNVTVTGTLSVSGVNTSLVVNGNNVGLGITQTNFGGTGAVAITAQNAVTLHGAMKSGGSVTINANQDNGGSESFSTTGNITTNGAAISVNAGGTGNITVQTLDTTDVSNPFADMVLLTAGGAIVDGNGTGDNVHANTLSVQAGTTINLDTEVSNLFGPATAFAAGGSITIRNSTMPLAVSQLETNNGSITISNAGGGIDVGTLGPVFANGKFQTLTLTTTGSGSDISFTAVPFDSMNPLTTGPSGAASGAVTISSGGAIVNDSGTTAPTTALEGASMRLTAATTIGTDTGSFTALTLSTTQLSADVEGPSAGGINIYNGGVVDTTGAGSPIPDLTLYQLTTASTSTTNGAINFITAGDLTVDGPVATNGTDGSGNSVTMSADSALSTNTKQGVFQLNGANIAGPGNVELILVTQFSMDSLSTVTGGNVEFLAPVAPPGGLPVGMNIGGKVTAAGTLQVVGAAQNSPNVIGISGQLASGGDLSILGNTGGTSDSDVISVAGQLASGGSVTIGSAASTSSSTTLVVSGSVAAANSVTLNGNTTGSTTVLITNPATLTDGGAGTLTLQGGATGSTFYQVDGTLNGIGSGGVVLAGSTGSGTSVIDTTGTITSLGAVAVTGGTTGSLDLNASGSITGSGAGATSAVIFTGSSNASNTFNVSGRITALGTDFTIQAGNAGDTVIVTGPVVTGTTANMRGGAGLDLFTIAPSTGSTFTFFNSGAGADSLTIDTNPAFILQSDPAFATPILFQSTTGFLPWTRMTGTWVVSPAVS